MRIAILGVGVVGSALRSYLTLDPANVLYLYDPGKNLQDDFLNECEATFICVPVETKDDRSQDLERVRDCLRRVQVKNKLIFLKSTVLPETCDKLAKEFDMRICHMPEFLTERQADDDMKAQDVICGGRELLSYSEMKMVERIFKDKKILFMRNIEAELAKYTHNAFCAVKVNFFNTIKQASDILGADYERVLEASFLSGFIEKTHTKVPGPDGKFGYGGKCLPKDLCAFIGFLNQEKIPADSLFATECENMTYRDNSK